MTTIKQSYSLYFLYDLLEIIRSSCCTIHNDEKLNLLYNAVIDYLCELIKLPEEGEILDISVLVTQKDSIY